MVSFLENVNIVKGHGQRNVSNSAHHLGSIPAARNMYYNLIVYIVTRLKRIYIFIYITISYNKIQESPEKFHLLADILYIIILYYYFVDHTHTIRARYAHPHTLRRPVSVTHIRCLRLVILAIAIKRFGSQCTACTTVIILSSYIIHYINISLSLVGRTLIHTRTHVRCRIV